MTGDRSGYGRVLGVNETGLLALVGRQEKSGDEVRDEDCEKVLRAISAVATAGDRPAPRGVGGNAEEPTTT
jgi:hypothetical protein